MLVNIEDINNIEKQLLFSVEPLRVEHTISSFIKEIAPRVDAKGFRKGMVPDNVIRHQYKDAILAECSARMVQEEVITSIRDRQLKVVGSPVLIEKDRMSNRKSHVGEFMLDGSFSFSVMADFEPELKVIVPDDLHISEAMPSLDSLVDDDLRKAQAALAQLDFVERPANKDDQVAVEFLDGSNNHASIMISDKPDIFASHEDFIGKSANDELEVPLADGSAVSVRITAVFAVTMPQIDNEFARSSMFESLDDMKKSLAAKRSHDYSTPLRAKIYSEILAQLVAANPVEIPGRWVDAEVTTICRRLNIEAQPGELLVSFKELARRNILSNLFLDSIYRDHENIHMSADEVFGIIESEAQKIGRTPDEVLTHLRNSGQYELLMSSYERNRAIDYLISQAQVKQEQV
jgi:trigger factor